MAFSADDNYALAVMNVICISTATRRMKAELHLVSSANRRVLHNWVKVILMSLGNKKSIELESFPLRTMHERLDKLGETSRLKLGKLFIARLFQTNRIIAKSTLFLFYKYSTRSFDLINKT